MPRGLLVCLLLLAASAAPAGAEGAPGRIAVAGTWPTGYVGLLSRYGLPHDVLLDYQLEEPETVSRYDLVILGGLPAVDIGACRTAFDRLLAKGGSLLIDYSTEETSRVNWFGARPTWGGDSFGRHAFHLADGDNPLRRLVGEQRSFPPVGEGYLLALTNPAKTTVLAEYEGGGRRTPGKAPAIVLEQVGAGKVLLCGPAVAGASGLEGVNYDTLMLGLVQVLLGSRAEPQLEPEGPRLRRYESIRSTHKDAPAGPEGPRDAGDGASERPAGPGKPGALPAGFTALEAEPAPEYNVSGKLGASPGELLLNYWSQSASLRVSLNHSGARVTRVEGGKASSIAVLHRRLPAGTPFTVKERAGRVLLLAGGAVASAPITGLWRGQTAARGLAEVRYQPVEPPELSDDFMRKPGDNGAWEVQAGNWSTAPVHDVNATANPFCFRVDAREPASALCGYPFWDEYRAAISARADGGKGSLGLGCCARDAQNLILFQARIRTAGALPDGFALVKLAGGKARRLASCAGGLVPGQWYRLEVEAREGSVTAFVDGVRVLSANEPGLSGGKVALRAEDAAARFDDALVEPADARQAGKRRASLILPSTGLLDVDTWAGPAALWEADSTAPGLFWRRGWFPGDTELRWELPALPAGGQAALVLDADGRSPDTGYVLSLSREVAGDRLELRHAGTLLGKADGVAVENATLSLHREGAQVIAAVNGRRVLSAPYAPAAGGGRVAFRAAGFRARASAISLTCANTHDYTFDTAPVGWWTGAGRWDLCTRWSCDPRWSWFGCSFDPLSAIWLKRPLEGDAVLDFYTGARTFENGPWNSDHMADFNAALCGDGKDVQSGYAFIAGENGHGAKLLRKGAVVAENKRFRWFSFGHNRWANVRVEKHGARLQLFVEGQLVLEYDDPQPLPGGCAAIWTRNNAIVLPYVSAAWERLGDKPLSLQ